MPTIQASSTSASGALLVIATVSVIVASMFLSGCSKPVEKTEDIRPVRVMTLHASNVAIDAEFSGEVRARVESRLGFRVGGKIVARKVDVGTVVKRGQVLMQLDPQDLQLAQAQAVAGMRANESNRDLAKAELKRYQDLRDKNFVSQALLDSKEATYKAAEANYEQAMALDKTQANQTAYTVLVADADGVVTGVDAEVGQVVAAGSPVVRVAQLGEKEIVIGIPEDQVEALRHVSDVKVRVWAHPNDSYAGKIREISPIADQATRTFTAKVSIPDAPVDVRLGMTAYVDFSSTTATPWIKVPLSALFQQNGNTAVWVVENNIAKLVPVQVGAPVGNDMLITSGVGNGQTVVTAGVNSLKQGQKVSILGADMQPAQAIATDEGTQPSSQSALPSLISAANAHSVVERAVK